MNKRPEINKTFSIGTNNSDVNPNIRRLRAAGIGLFLAVGILLATGTSAVASTSPSNELTTFGGPSDDTASSTWTNSAYSVTVDSAGNVYTAGSLIDLVYFGSGDNVAELDGVGTRDAYISKTDASGNLVWVKRFGGEWTRAFSITVDPLGNIYTGGYFEGRTDFDPGVNQVMRGSRIKYDRDGFVSKFDRDGNLIWARTFGGRVDDYVASVVATPSGHVYITGMFGESARFGSTPFYLPGGDYDRDYLDTEGFDWFIAKLDSDGELVWVEALGGSESPWEPGEATSTKPNGGLVVDAAGNPYITGYFSGTAHFGADDSATTITSVGDQDIFLAKFDSAGSLTWVESAGGNNSDEGHSVVTYGVDHVYTVGQMVLSGGFILASHLNENASSVPAPTSSVTTPGWAPIPCQYMKNGVPVAAWSHEPRCVEPSHIGVAALVAGIYVNEDEAQLFDPADALTVKPADAVMVEQADTVSFNEVTVVNVAVRPNSAGADRYEVLSNGSLEVHGDVSGVAASADTSGRFVAVDALRKGAVAVTEQGRIVRLGSFEQRGAADNALIELGLKTPVVDVSANQDGQEYVVLSADGGLFGFGRNFSIDSYDRSALTGNAVALLRDGSDLWVVDEAGHRHAVEGAETPADEDQLTHIINDVLSTQLNGAIVGAVRTADGVVMLGADGGIFALDGDEFNSDFLGATVLAVTK